jgi:uncharacterized protein
LFKRLQRLTTAHSFFLFGPRGSGKSTLLRSQFTSENSLTIDLLDDEQERRFVSNPNELQAVANGLNPNQKFVVIDEVQKIPKLLDVVHILIERKACHFALSGSSARKLKAGGANLLAGRAFVFDLFPLSYVELGSAFSLASVLAWGSLPKIFDFDDDLSRRRYLNSYANTYLKEEIYAEQLVRNSEGFRRFLEIAAQCNGKIVNYLKVARAIGLEDKTVKTYFEILEDTFVGFFLQPYHPSFRKRFQQKPKFYFLDTGIARVLSNALDVPLHPSTSAYGEAFENLVVTEIFKLNRYTEKNYKLSFLQTTSGVEVDLVVERPGRSALLIEIKSADVVSEESLARLTQIHKDFPASEALFLCNAKTKMKYGEVWVLPWKDGILEFVFDSSEL